MPFTLQVLKLQTLNVDDDAGQGDVALLSSFSVLCPLVPTGARDFECR